MPWIVTWIRWIMIVSGALTMTMIYAALAPTAALRSTFGDTLEGPVAEIVVRNWGALIGLIGAMLLYGAFHPPVRVLVLLVAGISKIIFIGLVLSQGSRFIGQAGLPIAIDAIAAGLFCWYVVVASNLPSEEPLKREVARSGR